MKNLKNTWDAWKYYLLMLLVLCLPVAQCSYDNYIKYKIAKGVSK